MVIDSERQFLPIVKAAVLGREHDKESFLDFILPIFDAFLSSNTPKDEYQGWSFNILFVNAALSDCEPYGSEVMSGDSKWYYHLEGKDDCAYVIPKKGLIKLHLHSFLWNM